VRSDRLAIAFLFVGCLVGGARGQTPNAGPAPNAVSPLSYDAALALATSRNLSLEAARRQRAIREAGVRTARQVPNPDVAIEITRDVPHQIASFNLPVEIGGKRARRIDLAREESTLADVAVQAEMRAIRRDVRQAFYSLLASGLQVEIAEGVVDIARRVRDAAQARFESGAAPRLDVLQADLGVARAETELDLARSARTAARASLNGALNLAPRQATTVTGDLLDNTQTPDYEGALAIATTSNVDLRRLDREIAIEQQRLNLLRAERIPTPVFSVGGVFNAPGEFNAGLSGAVGIGLPIFSRNQGEIATTIATSSQLVAERDATNRTIENTIFGTLATIEARRQQVHAYRERLVPTASDLESLAEESYRAGRTSVLAVFDAQRSLRDLRREALQAAYELQVSIADLEELLGTSIP
jgi:cobalt-zinc-cadmium efflux system outer membrane protein